MGKIVGTAAFAGVTAYDAVQKSVLWSLPAGISGFSAIKVAELDGTSPAEVIAADGQWGNVTVYRYTSGAPQVVTQINSIGDGVDSVLLGTATLYNPYFTAFDFSSNTKQWSSPVLSGSPAAVTHADVNGDGVPDLIGITSDGHLYAWDVRDQLLIWSTSGIGAGVDVAVGDVYGDGNQEIIALTSTQLLVFTQGATGLMQKASYPITGMDLLVADTNGDGKAEIYLLASISSSSNLGVYQFDGSLTLQNSYPLPSTGAAPNSLYLESSAFPRKNIVVALGGDSYSYTVAPTLEVIDPTSGAQIWQSPPLRGYVPPNSLNFYDLSGSGQLQIVFGTSVGMYVTQ